MKKKKTYNKDKSWSLLKIQKCLEKGIARSASCSIAWVAHSTFYKRMEEESFSEKIKFSEALRLWYVEKKKAKKIEENYRPAIISELKSKAPQIYNIDKNHQTTTEDEWQSLNEMIDSIIE